MSYPIYLWDTKKTNNPREFEYHLESFAQIADRFRTPIRTHETTETYHGWKLLQKTETDKEKKKYYSDMIAFAKNKGSVFFGEFYPDAENRKKESVKSRSMLTFDLDYNMKRGSFQQIEKILNRTGFQYILHTTHTHLPESPRIRIILPLLYPIADEKEFMAVSRAVFDLLFLDYSDTSGGIDDSSMHEYSRFMYVPSCPRDGEYLFQCRTDGKPLDNSQIQIDKERYVQGSTKKKPKTPEEAYTRPGLAGTFNRLYPIERAIQEFDLPYEKHSENRYTYTEGSGMPGGLIIYNSAWAYSHYNTDLAGRNRKDPAGDKKAFTAYDMVFAHKMSEEDVMSNNWAKFNAWLYEKCPGLPKEVIRDNAKKEEAQINAADRKDAETLFREFQKHINDDTFRPISTGFSEMDRELDGGFYPASLITCGAVSSLGKTTAIWQIAGNMAGAGIDVLFFSLEMSADEMMAKGISRKSAQIKRDYNHTGAFTMNDVLSPLKRRAFTQEQNLLLIQSMQALKEEFGDHMFLIAGVGEITTKKIRRHVEDHLAKRKQQGKICPVCIFVDYLQVLQPDNDRLSEKQVTDKNILDLKMIANDFKVPVVVMSSFSRAFYTEPVTSESFKSSGNIEYGSDVLIGIQYEGMDYQKVSYQKKDGTLGTKYQSPQEHARRVKDLIDGYKADGFQGLAQPIHFKILKNRRYATGSFRLRMYPKYNLFESTEAEEFRQILDGVQDELDDIPF